jgi:CDP-paratose 2-epimerase
MKTILITGAAGFIGTNCCIYFRNKGFNVIAFDNFSRKTSHINKKFLKDKYNIRVENADIRDQKYVFFILKKAKPSTIIHLAGQVAVTTSVLDPLGDFKINAGGTLNLLDACRRYSPQTFFINASTNKVYGKISNLKIKEESNRYKIQNQQRGISESCPLDFHSPYGCSKGVADQYTLDYARIYGLKTVTMRQSCIYGPRQFGMEDQGWIAWFSIAAILNKPITIYGNGKQVRDVLHVSDLCRAYELAIKNNKRVSGLALNIGGGANNTLSLIELIDIIEKELKQKIMTKRGAWRPGDQPIYVSDLSCAKKILNWSPVIGAKKGVQEVIQWTQKNTDLLKK